MGHHLYKLLWQLETDVSSFVHCEFKVFRAEAEAKEYGKRRERELNRGESIERRAEEGYYFKYCGSQGVEQIDGFLLNLEKVTKGDR
jgi:hypothetical protein